MQVADSVRDSECGLEMEVQGAVAERRQIHESSAVMDRLQRESQIDGDSGCTATTFGVDDGEDFSTRTFAPRLAASCRKADEGFQKIGGVGGTLDVFAYSGPHGAHN